MNLFENAINSINPNNLNLTNIQTQDGSSVIEWFKNISLFDYAI